MEGIKRNGIIVVSLHFIGMAFMIPVTVVFFNKQYEKVDHSFTQMFKNKFVVLTLFLAFCSIMSDLFLIPKLYFGDFGFDPVLSNLSYNMCEFMSALFMLSALGVHIVILYLRTQALVQTDAMSTLRKIFKLIIVLFVGLSVPVVLLQLRLFYTRPDMITQDLNDVYFVISGLYGISEGLIDIIATFWFWKHAQRAQEFFIGRDNHEHVIARRGVYICVCSFIGTIAYAVRCVSQNKDVLTRSWAITVVILVFYAITTLWMLMKLELDQNQQPLEDSSVKSDLNLGNQFRAERLVDPTHLTDLSKVAE